LIFYKLLDKGLLTNKKLGIWICRSKIKKLNNHQKSNDLYRNVGGGFSRVSFLGVRGTVLYEKIFLKKILSWQNVIHDIFWPIHNVFTMICNDLQ
jgi:hypothetical protein